MASGQRALRLTRLVSWSDFDRYAAALVAALGGHVTSRADSPVERVWAVQIDGGAYWLALDDFGLGVSLDPRDAAAGEAIERIRSRLVALRDGI